MHFIWLGDAIFPEEYNNYIKSWINEHKDWVFCFWNDQNIPKLINQKYFDETDVYAMKADILRYELLYIFGGVYVDCDFLCFKNIDKIIDNYHGFSGYECDKYIAIGLMGFVKKSVLLYNIIKTIPYNIINSYNKKRIPEMTGPIFFTEMWKKHVSENKQYRAFSKEYFYSYTFEDKYKGNVYERNNDLHYAIHMWGNSWNKTSIKQNCNKYFIENILKEKIIKPFENNKNAKENIYYKIDG
jgi:mannosyltransferase OCH1-like enzyme